MLVVSAERRREKAEREHVKYVRMERRLGKFLKKLELHENADNENITATYRDGVLTVTVPKMPPPKMQKLRTIQVQVGLKHDMGSMFDNLNLAQLHTFICKML